MPPFNYSDLWDAYVSGAKDGQQHPREELKILHQSADAYCKLQQLKFEDCPDCGGSGEFVVRVKSITVCATCKGSGKVRKE